MANCLSAHPTISLSISPSVHCSTSLSIDMFVHHTYRLSIKPSVHHTTHLSVNPSVCHTTSLSVNPSVSHTNSQSVDTSVCHSTYPSVNMSIHFVHSMLDAVYPFNPHHVQPLDFCGSLLHQVCIHPCDCPIIHIKANPGQLILAYHGPFHCPAPFNYIQQSG